MSRMAMAAQAADRKDGAAMNEDNEDFGIDALHDELVRQIARFDQQLAMVDQQQSAIRDQLAEVYRHLEIAKHREIQSKYLYEEAMYWLVEIGMPKAIRYRAQVRAYLETKEDAEFNLWLAKQNEVQP